MKLYKIAALFLIILFVFSACSEAEEIVPEYNSAVSGDDPDLNGYEYTITAITHGGQYALNAVSGETARGDRLLQRYRETEEKYNCKIRIVDGSSLATYLTYKAADLKYADLMFNMINELTHGFYIQNGYFASFSDIGIDLESGMYGTPGVIEAGHFKDGYYAIIAYYWGFPAADTTPTMWYNPYVLSTYRQPSPHELREQGEWNWAAIEKMCEEVRDTSDPDPAKHTYALAYTSEAYLETGVLYSNGARAIRKDESGRLVYTFNDPRTIEALQFVRSLVERDLICDGGDRQNITPFIENRRAFFLEYTHLGLSDEGAENLAYKMEDAYEWIYFPDGPSYDGSPRTSYSYFSRLFFAPIDTDFEVQSILLPYLFQPLPGTTEETWQDEFKRTTFFTEDSFDCFAEMRDNAFFDYLAYTDFTVDYQPKILKITRGTAGIQETLEALEDKMQAQLDRYYNRYLE